MRLQFAVNFTMAKVSVCLLSLVMFSVCVYAQQGKNCATTLCAAVACNNGEEPFYPPGQCCQSCRPAQQNDGKYI